MVKIFKFQSKVMNQENNNSNDDIGINNNWVVLLWKKQWVLY